MFDALQSASLLAAVKPRQNETVALPAIRTSHRAELADLGAAEQMRSFRDAQYKAIRFLYNQVGRLDRRVTLVGFERTLEGRLKETRQPLPLHPVSLMFSKGSQGQPNPWQTSGNFLAQEVIDLMLTGSHYGLKVRAATGSAIEWELRLRPDWMKVIPDESVGIAGFRFRPGGLGGESGITFLPEDIVHTKLPSPIDDRIGWSPLRSMAFAADLGHEIRRFQWQFFEQGARLDGVLEGTVSKEQREELYDTIREHHYHGTDTAWLPLVLPQGIKFTATQASAKDFEFAALAKFSEADIMEAYGVPKGLLGTVEDVSLANLRGLMVIAAENGIKPILRIIEEHLEAQMLNEFEPESTGGPPLVAPRLEFDFDDPTPGDPDQQRKQLETDLKHGVVVINEVRAGRGDVSVDWGDRPWLPLNVVQPGDEDDDDDDDDDERSLPPAIWDRQTGLTEDEFVQAMVRALGTLEDQRTLRDLLPPLAGTFFRGSEHIAEFLGEDAIVLEGHPAFESYRTEVLPQALGVNESTRQRMRALARELREAPAPEQLAAVRDRFNDFRRGRRGLFEARIQGGKAWHFGAIAEMAAQDVPASLWITQRDDDVRDSHLIDGQCRNVGTVFLLRSGVSIRFPHDPSSPIGELANCRCTLAPAPGGCGNRGALETDAQRATYWRGVVAVLGAQERLIRRQLRAIWQRQGRALVAALAELA